MPKPTEIANEAEELKAEAEIAATTKAAAEASPDEEINGISPSNAVLHLKSNPTPKSQYNTSLQDSEKPLLLVYFTIQGLGEVPKLLLAEAGMAYECIAMPWVEDQALSMEWRSRSPNGLMPILSGGGIPRSSPICQSGAIIRFLAKKLGMDGGSDAVACSRADVLYETAKDLGDGDKKKEIAAVKPTKDYSSAKGPFALGKRIEKMLMDMADPKDESSVLNCGQLQLFQILENCEARRAGCVKENLGDIMDTFRLDMSNRSGLKEYLNSTARFRHTCADKGLDGGYSFAAGALKRKDIKY